MDERPRELDGEAAAPPESPQWGRPTRIVVTVLLILAAIWALSLIGPVAPLLVLAVLFAFIIYVPCRRLRQALPIAWPLAVSLVYVCVIILFLVAIAFAVPLVIQGGATAVAAINQTVAFIQEEIRTGRLDDLSIQLGALRIDLTPLVRPLTQGDAATLTGALNTALGSLAGWLTGALSSVTSTMTTTLIALMLSFFILLDWEGLRDRAIDSLSPGYRREVTLLVSKTYRLWTSFFRSQIIISLLLAIVSIAQLVAMGIPNGVVLGFFAGLMQLIPFVGGFIGAIVLAAVAFFSGSSFFPDMPRWLLVILVVVINIVLTQIVWNFFSPRILGQALDLPVSVTIVGVFVGAAIAGPLGAFLITPLISTARLYVTYLIRKIQGAEPFPGELPLAPLQPATPVLETAPAAEARERS